MAPAGNPTSTLTARQEQGRRSRDRILNAAEGLIAERGYSATSISMIAKSSGLPASSIYWHFDSKEELLGAVVERVADDWLRNQSSWQETDGDLASYLKSIEADLATRPEFPRLMMQLILEGSDGALAGPRRHVQDLWLSIRSGLERVLSHFFGLGSNHQDQALAKRLASVMLAYVDGLVLTSHVDPEASLTDRFDDLATALTAIASAGRRS